MEPRIIPIGSSSHAGPDTSNTSFQVNLADVFTRSPNSYLNGFSLYITYYNTIPNFIGEGDIDCKKAVRWFGVHYRQEVKDSYYSKLPYGQNKKAELDDVFYFLYEDLLVDFDTNNSRVRFLFKKTDIVKVEEVIAGIKKFRCRKTFLTPEISLLVNGRSGIDTKKLKITRPRLNIEDNYNDDFREIHQTILKRLSRKNDKGLVLLHGKPGTGKTSYIRYLAGRVKKEVIFLPPNMASAITNPDLISILIDHPNSIFVIEDAENIVMDREKKGSSPVSALLNISDGLLADCLNIQVICSFNTDLSKVDNALLRKGRLIANYEFKELETAKANALSVKLGFQPVYSEPAILSCIYNQDEKDFQQVKKSNPVGFLRT